MPPDLPGKKTAPVIAYGFDNLENMEMVLLRVGRLLIMTISTEQE